MSQIVPLLTGQSAAAVRLSEALESEGAKESDLTNRRKAADKDLAAIRETYEAELELLNRVWEEFKDLFPRQIIEDEMLWRELEDRFGPLLHNELRRCDAGAPTLIHRRVRHGQGICRRAGA